MTESPVAGMSLHHVGYVVSDIASSIESFAVSMNAQWDKIISEDPFQRVKVAFLTTCSGDAQIELVEPVGEGSPVSDFLRKGGGLHHICYEVDDLEAQLSAFRSRRALIAKRPKPAVAFHGRRIAWVVTAEKLLVELLEREAKITSEPR